MGQDQFGFYYTLKNNVFFKFKGKETFEYKNISLGKITKVDFKNPLKIVLFYEDFNTAVLLDNQLNETQKINFSENEIPITIIAIGLASQNQLWIYNSLNQQIGLYDYLKKDYKTISTPFTENIKYYQSDFNIFNWIDKNNNWYSCTVFGKITHLGKVPDFDEIQMVNNHEYLFSKNGRITLTESRKIESEASTDISISEKTFKKFCYTAQILSIFTSEGITNYKIKIP